MFENGNYEYKKTTTQETKFDHDFGGYEWARPGMMQQYVGITRLEALDVIAELVKRNGGSILKTIK